MRRRRGGERARSGARARHAPERRQRKKICMRAKTCVKRYQSAQYSARGNKRQSPSSARFRVDSAMFSEPPASKQEMARRGAQVPYGA